jgi:threonine dehydrogenase-like Zn-dependent dehydrogenase
LNRFKHFGAVGDLKRLHPVFMRCLGQNHLAAKEASIETIFRDAHVHPRALALMASGKIDLKPLISRTFEFRESIDAFNFALKPPRDCVKAQIRVAQDEATT